MRDVVVFFKSPSDRQMSDPGEQLRQVLSFKKKLESERRVLYRTFDSLEEFGHELRRLLSKWSRDWTGGQPTKAPLPPAAPAPAQAAPAGSVVEQAKALAKQGQNTAAHQLFTQATTGTYDQLAWIEYVRFLRRTGRYGLLQSATDMMIEKARDLKDHYGAAEAFANLGIAKRAQGQRRTAIQLFEFALHEVDVWEASDGPCTESTSMRAFVRDNMGLTWRRMKGDLPRAIAAIEEAIELHDAVGDARGKAHALRNIGIVYLQLGNLDDAVASFEGAARVFRQEDDERGLSMTLASLGEALELQGDATSAIEQFHLALGLNTDLGNNQGKSMNYSQLSRALVATGGLVEAREFAQASIDLNDRVGDTEGTAAGLHAMGRVILAEGDPHRAIELLSDSLLLFQQLDQPAGIAAAAIDLTRAHLSDDSHVAARETFAVAERALIESPHFGLSRQAEAVKILLGR